MSRKILAIVEVDEDVARQLDESYAPGEYFEREFGWLQDSGISLRDWLVSDDDDVDIWARYIDYLIEWAFENACKEDGEGAKLPKPLSYKAWIKESGQKG